MCSSPNLGLCRVESSMRVPVPSELCVFTSTYSIKSHEPVTKCSIHSKVKQHQNVEVWSRERFTEGPCNETDVWCPPPQILSNTLRAFSKAIGVLGLSQEEGSFHPTPSLGPPTSAQAWLKRQMSAGDILRARYPDPAQPSSLRKSGA